MHKSTIKRAEAIKRILKENFEPGRQDRSKMWVLRNIVSKTENPVSASTFFRYLKIDESENVKQEDKNQLKLF